MYIVHYPYLQEIYHNYDDEDSRQKRQRFLDSIDNFLNQRKYVRITLLDWNENPIKEIQGELTSGSLVKDGTSAVRRSCNFSATLNGGDYDIQDLELNFSINKKIYLETGIKNDSREYLEYPILWFPQGLFFITSLSLSSSTTSGVNITIQCKDKMCLLNGEIGGLFPASTILDIEDTQDYQGVYQQKKVLIYDLIQELVHHFGQEPLQNIVIENVDKTIKRVMQWNGDNKLYIVRHESVDGSTPPTYQATLDKPEEQEVYRAYGRGDDVGYTIDDFYFAKDFTVNAGQTICSALDTIKNYLGNYEYFYDIYGIFHFQEIKNYLNTTQGKILIKDMDRNDYLVDATLSKDLYSFDSNRNLVSINVNPQYLNIKNDYIVQGLRRVTNTNAAYPVRYHLVIDKKPTGNNHSANEIRYKSYIYSDVAEEPPQIVDAAIDLSEDPRRNRLYAPRENFVVYEEEESGLHKGGFVVPITSIEQAPNPANFNLIYGVVTDGELQLDQLWYWNDGYHPLKTLAVFPQYYPIDWRTELYVQGLLARNNATDTTQYFVELESGWPAMYDLINQEFWAESLLEDSTVNTNSADGTPVREDDLSNYMSSYATSGDYFLDFIDPSQTSLGKYAVSAIGRRQFIHTNDEVNCLFLPHIPEIIYINNEADPEEIDRQDRWAVSNNIPFCQVRGDIYNNLYTGGYRNAAFDEISYDITQHTIYQTNISMMTIPADYMEPNTRVAVSDKTTNTYGSYVITNISMPLSPGGSMSVTAHEAFERY